MNNPSVIRPVCPASTDGRDLLRGMSKEGFKKIMVDKESVKLLGRRERAFKPRDTNMRYKRSEI